MNTSDTRAGDVKPAVTITEADVVAFMQAKADELSRKTGGLFAAVKVEAKRHGTFHNKPGASFHEFTSYVDQDIHRSAPTLADAMQASLLTMDPAIRAVEMRKQAAKLLADAEALVPRAVVEEKEGAAA